MSFNNDDQERMFFGGLSDRDTETGQSAAPNAPTSPLNGSEGPNDSGPFTGGINNGTTTLDPPPGKGQSTSSPELTGAPLGGPPRSPLNGFEGPNDSGPASPDVMPPEARTHPLGYLGFDNQSKTWAWDQPYDIFDARLSPGHYTTPAYAESAGFTRFPTEKVGLTYEDYLASSPSVQQALAEALGLTGNYYSRGDAQGAAAIGRGLESKDINLDLVKAGGKPQDFLAGLQGRYYPDQWNVDPVSRGEVFQEPYVSSGVNVPFRQRFGRRF